MRKYGIVSLNEKIFQEGVMDDAKKCRIVRNYCGFPWSAIRV